MATITSNEINLQVITDKARDYPKDDVTLIVKGDKFIISIRAHQVEQFKQGDVTNIVHADLEALLDAVGLLTPY